MILCPISSFVDKVCSTLESEFSIPTKRRSKPSIPEEFWKLLLVLRMLNAHDSLALREWLTIIGVDETRISRIRKGALESGSSLYDYSSALSDADIKSIFDQLLATYEQRTDLQRFKDALMRFAGLHVDEEMFSFIHFDSISSPENQDYLGSIIQQIYEQFGLLDEQDENTADISDEDKVLVTTMYSAKGLEAEFVFIMWMNEHWMPMPGRDIREQLRVLYVGITRAKQDVVFTFHEKHDGVKRIKQEAMSPFLQKIRSSLDIKRVMKSDL
jgi:superfamily I DNA/RNA helicase